MSDTAVSGRELLIHLKVRRFFCGNVACSKKIFSEQVPGLTVRYGRRSVGLAQVLRAARWRWAAGPVPGWVGGWPPR